MVSKGTIKYLEKREDEKARAVAALAVNADIPYTQAEKQLDAITEECICPTGIQKAYEVSMNRELGSKKYTLLE